MPHEIGDTMKTTTTLAPVIDLTPTVEAVEKEVDRAVTVVSGTSVSFQLDAHDLKGLGRNMLIILVAYGVTYFSQHVMSVDVDSTTIMIVPIVAGVIDAAVRFFKSNK
jgi:hypothetical protein